LLIGGLCEVEDDAIKGLILWIDGWITIFLEKVRQGHIHASPDEFCSMISDEVGHQG